MHGVDPCVRYIGKQDADHDVQLKAANQASPPFGRRNLRDIHGSQYRGSPDTQPSNKPKEDERSPIPGEGASQGRDHIEDRHYAKAVPASELLSGYTGSDGPNDRA